ncbi:hypothetical protein [Sphingomonas prati]|uniref:Uncharacterized protein n=1 Tax=Sphingomonas prati TaxID=1843237 RepID=A0A7W9BRM7_9SPHN|nr:hypothetical protein [Sphingomonas prati]MBB5728871.1 hypothetical protein [Sphingomonas prati]
MLLAVVVTLVIGAVLAVYVLQRSEPARRLIGLEPAVVAAPVVIHDAPVPRSVTQAVAVTTDLARRVERTEQGIAQLAERTTESSSNAERAEGLLVAFAARRALDRGGQLGYIEGLLRERFGGNQPQAVATILSASRQPVTLEELQTGMDEIAPTLLARGTDDSWWQGVRRELAGLVVVRRASVPSVAPVDRLTRARRQLESGHVDTALAEIARLPGRALAGAWIIKARRYVSARRALDIIETAALLAPHRPIIPAAIVAPADPVAAAPAPANPADAALATGTDQARPN